MSHDAPLISVIIPTFNRAAFLPTALASIYAQATRSLQVIVVDDGSTDHTAAVVRDFDAELTYLYQANRGPVAARNCGLDQARGEWVTFLDSDDQWVAGRLQRQLALAAADPTAQIIWGMLQVVRQCPHDPTRVEPVGGPTLQTQLGSALFRRALFAADSVGRLDENLYTNDDVDWFCRALEQGIEMIVHHDVVAFYHWHQSNLVADQPQATHGLLHALALSLKRRRQQGKGVAPATLPANIHMIGKESEQVPC